MKSLKWPSARLEKDPFGIPGHQCIIQDMTDAIVNDRQPVVSEVREEREL